MNGSLVAHAAEVRRVAGAYGAVSVRVFGSYARGTATPGSDVDLLVRLEPGRDLIDLVGLKLRLQELLGCPVDVVEEDGLSPYLRDEILREARPL
jgi:predicted nucleotidyltransferase